MKYVQSIIFRALSALCVGGLLLAFPDETTRWLVIIIGILFLIPGLVSLAVNLRVGGSRDSARPLFSIVGIGSFFFGVVLILASSSLIPYMKYVLAIFSVLAGIGFLGGMLGMRKYTRVEAFFYVVPLLITLAGLFVLLKDTSVTNPDGSTSDPAANTIIGIACLVYGVLNLASAIRFRKIRRQLVLDAQKAEPVDETSATDAAPDTATVQPTDCDEQHTETEVNDKAREAARTETQKEPSPSEEPDKDKKESIIFKATDGAETEL